MSTRTGGVLTILLTASVLSAACDGSGTPTSPEALNGPGGSTSAAATISGALVGPTGSAMSGLTVAVAGTSAAVHSDAAGRFALAGVPTGDIQLHFSGPSTNASVPLADVKPSEAIDVTISVSGSTATITASNRPGNQGNGVDLPVNGIVSAFSGTPVAFQFQVDEHLIRGDANTEFFGNSHFSQLANGVRVEVKGTRKVDHVYADRIHVNLPDNPDPEPEPGPASIEGTLTALSGLVPTLTLTVDSTTVLTDGDTIVRRRGDVQPLTTLVTGMTVHVVGTRQSSGALLARMVQIKDDAVGGVFEIEGSLGGLHGTCPAITFGVNGYPFAADAATTFTPACSTFKSGNKVKVTGILQADGSVKVTALEKQ